MAIKELKRSKSPCIDQISAELLKAVGRTIRSDIHKLVNSIWNKEGLPDEWKESITVPIYKKGDKTDCNNYTVRSESRCAFRLRYVDFVVSIEVAIEVCCCFIAFSC
jgi:hypothetical protein